MTNGYAALLEFEIVPDSFDPVVMALAVTRLRARVLYAIGSAIVGVVDIREYVGARAVDMFEAAQLFFEYPDQYLTLLQHPRAAFIAAAAAYDPSKLEGAQP